MAYTPLTRPLHHNPPSHSIFQTHTHKQCPPPQWENLLSLSVQRFYFRNKAMGRSRLARRVTRQRPPLIVSKYPTKPKNHLLLLFPFPSVCGLWPLGMDAVCTFTTKSYSWISSLSQPFFLRWAIEKAQATLTALVILEQAAEPVSTPHVRIHSR